MLPLVGHRNLRDRFRGAARRGRLPQSLLLHGPPGIGKQRLALWLAAAVQCEADPDRRPCRSCRSCRLADSIQHPDIHWTFPLERPKGARDKLREKLEESRLEQIAARREKPLYASDSNPAAAIYLAAVEELRLRAARRPAMGQHSVFVIGDADRMVPQAASPEAANAFLKLLEEPPPDTFVFLTSSRPGLLLPTIRSRVLAVRVLRVADEEVAEFLCAEGGVDRERAQRLALEVQGSIGLAWARFEEEEDGGEALPERANDLLAIGIRGSREDRLRAACRFGATGAREMLAPLLAEMSLRVRDALALDMGGRADALRPDLARRILGDTPVPPLGLLAVHQHVERAREAAAANVSPQAIMGVLLQDIAESASTDQHLVLHGWNSS